MMAFRRAIRSFTICLLVLLLLSPLSSSQASSLESNNSNNRRDLQDNNNGLSFYEADCSQPRTFFTYVLVDIVVVSPLLSATDLYGIGQRFQETYNGYLTQRVCDVFFRRIVSIRRSFLYEILGVDTVRVGLEVEAVCHGDPYCPALLFTTYLNLGNLGKRGLMATTTAAEETETTPRRNINNNHNIRRSNRNLQQSDTTTTTTTCRCPNFIAPPPGGIISGISSQFATALEQTVPRIIYPLRFNEFMPKSCDTRLTSFTSTVRVELIIAAPSEAEAAELPLLSENDLSVLQRGFLEVYNGIQEDNCDSFFRNIQDVATLRIDDNDEAVVGDGTRKLQLFVNRTTTPNPTPAPTIKQGPLFTVYLSFIIRGVCRGCAKFDRIFDDGIRSDRRQRRTQQQQQQTASSSSSRATEDSVAGSTTTTEQPNDDEKTTMNNEHGNRDLLFFSASYVPSTPEDGLCFCPKQQEQQQPPQPPSEEDFETRYNQFMEAEKIAGNLAAGIVRIGAVTQQNTTTTETTTQPTTSRPTFMPTSIPTPRPTERPTPVPTTSMPTTAMPTTLRPTTIFPTTRITAMPSASPTISPSATPTTKIVLPTTQTPTTQTPTFEPCAGRCHEAAVCDEFFTCRCPEGYVGDGVFLCNPRDNCGNVCDPAHGFCNNNATSTTTTTAACACLPGYQGTGLGSGSCADVDECALAELNECRANGTVCENTMGGYECI